MERPPRGPARDQGLHHRGGPRRARRHDDRRAGRGRFAALTVGSEPPFTRASPRAGDPPSARGDASEAVSDLASLAVLGSIAALIAAFREEGQGKGLYIY